MRHVLLFAVLSCWAVFANAQGYTPVGTVSKIGGSSALLKTPGCAQTDTPTPATLKTKRFETRTTIKTGSELAKLNVSWLGGIGGGFNANSLYAVSDTGKFGECLSQDGKTTMEYGQVVRMIIQMNNYSVDANASIAIVAASATVTGKTNTVDLYEIGFGDKTLDSKLIDAKQSVGGSGVNIDNYSDFIKAVYAAEKYATTIENPGIEIVGYEVPPDEVASSIAVAWAVKEMAGGRGCEDATKDFKGDPKYRDAIRAAYQSVVGGCGVDNAGKRKAAQLLNGLKIKY